MCSVTSCVSLCSTHERPHYPWQPSSNTSPPPGAVIQHVQDLPKDHWLAHISSQWDEQHFSWMRRQACQEALNCLLLRVKLSSACHEEDGGFSPISRSRSRSAPKSWVWFPFFCLLQHSVIDNPFAAYVLGTAPLWSCHLLTYQYSEVLSSLKTFPDVVPLWLLPSLCFPCSN